MASKSEQEQILLAEEAINNALRDNIDTACYIMNAARFVDSYDEALSLADSANRKYNRFDIFFLIFDTVMSNLEFSVYLNRNMKECYIRFDDIPSEDLRIPDKNFPKLCAKIRYENFYNDIEDFADNVLEPELKKYYAETVYKLTDNNHNYGLNYVEHGDFEGIIRFAGGIFNLKKITALIDLTDFFERAIDSSIVKQYKEQYIVDVGSFYTADSLDNTYTYIIENNFLWCKSNYRSKIKIDSDNNIRLIRLE